ncbi:MAG: phosphoribosylamine--glycine ligase, partial [Planctomycetota bacterium]
INTLLVGGGGREHALAMALRTSDSLGELHVSHADHPGLRDLGHAVNVPVSAREAYRIEQYCDKHDIGLVVIGPEEPLAEGLADKMRKPNRVVFGPGKVAAQLEADKSWTKQLLRAAAVPTGEARAFTHAEQAHAYLDTRRDLPVVKASGLAKGKGVVVPESMDEAHAAVDAMLMQHAFGDAGNTVLIEERLEGQEVSVFAITDGASLLTLPTCQDHKRLRNADRGPNTGGMGAFCPSDRVDDALIRMIEREVLIPTLDALRREEIEYRGVLYAGLMLTPAGPKVLEYNVRFGDPECQVLMSMFRGDLVDLLHATATGQLERAEPQWADGAACTVVLASEGYPEKPTRNQPIAGVDRANEIDGVNVHLGSVTRAANGDLVTAGGRVLAVTAQAGTLAAARQRAYEGVDLIHFKGRQYRTDIAQSAEPQGPAGGVQPVTSSKPGA